MQDYRRNVDLAFENDVFNTIEYPYLLACPYSNDGNSKERGFYSPTKTQVPQQTPWHNQPSNHPIGINFGSAKLTPMRSHVIYMVVGAPGDERYLHTRGNVYVYALLPGEPDSFTEIAILNATDGNRWVSTEVPSYTIIVGATFDHDDDERIQQIEDEEDYRRSEVGSVHIFTRSSKLGKDWVRGYEIKTKRWCFSRSVCNRRCSHGGYGGSRNLLWIRGVRVSW
jgi:hypothetical protein